MPDRPDDITVRANTLHVCAELGPDNESAFGEAARRLLESTDDPLVIDLTDVHYMSSSYVRHMVAFAIEADRLGRRIRLLAGQRAIRMLEFGGLEKFDNVELVPKG